MSTEQTEAAAATGKVPTRSEQIAYLRAMFGDYHIKEVDTPFETVFKMGAWVADNRTGKHVLAGPRANAENDRGFADENGPIKSNEEIVYFPTRVHLATGCSFRAGVSYLHEVIFVRTWFTAPSTDPCQGG